MRQRQISARQKSSPWGQLPPWPHPSAKAFGFHREDHQAKLLPSRAYSCSETRRKTRSPFVEQVQTRRRRVPVSALKENDQTHGDHVGSIRTAEQRRASLLPYHQDTLWLHRPRGRAAWRPSKNQRGRRRARPSL